MHIIVQYHNRTTVKHIAARTESMTSSVSIVLSISLLGDTLPAILPNTVCEYHLRNLKPSLNGALTSAEYGLVASTWSSHAQSCADCFQY